MWTIHYDDKTVSYNSDTKEIRTNSPALEALVLQAIQNPPTLFATPTGPAEIFRLESSYLAYYMTANILFNKLGVQDWQVQGDYQWPFDHETTGARTTFSYVDYLKTTRTETITAANSCHNPYEGESYDRELKNYLENKTQASSQTENITTQSDSATKYVEYLRNHRLGGESN